MLIDKYIVEGYEDFIHSYGYFKLTHIFINKYQIIIVINDENKIINIFRSEKPKNEYSLVMKSITSPIDKIEVSDEFVEKAYTILCTKEKIKSDENELIKLINWDNFLSNSEKIEIKFKEALDIFNKEKYEDAIKMFNELIEFTTDYNYKSISYYNIACSYAQLKQKENVIKYLDQSIFYGYNNWQHIILDDDLKEYINEQEIVEIIKKIYNSNPNYRELNICSINFKLPKDIDYLVKHNIQLSESMSKYVTKPPAVGFAGTYSIPKN